MQLIRMFSNDDYKGTKGYLNTQKYYELGRTILYFGISMALFVGGWITTGNRINLLTIVAILGCLPASKSLVETIIYFRYKGCPENVVKSIEDKKGDLTVLYDMAFTSYDATFVVDSICVRGNTVCGYTSSEKFDEQKFYKHIDERLKMDQYKDTTVKIFKDSGKYLQRMEQMKELGEDEKLTKGIAYTLKCVSL